MLTLEQRLAQAVRDIDQRLRHLESLEYIARADTVDGLHAAATPEASALLGLDVNGSFPAHSVAGAITLDAGLVLATSARQTVIAKTGISDNTPTDLFTITTTNEAGFNDGGAWVAHLFVLASAAATSAEANVAAVGLQASITHVVSMSGDSVTSIDTWHTGTAAAIAPASRNITTAAITVTDTSAYVVTVGITIDWSGFFATTGQCVVLVVLEWTGFTTPPVIAAV